MSLRALLTMDGIPTQSESSKIRALDSSTAFSLEHNTQTYAKVSSLYCHRLDNIRDSETRGIELSMSSCIEGGEVSCFGHIIHCYFFPDFRRSIYLKVCLGSCLIQTRVFYPLFVWPRGCSAWTIHVQCETCKGDYNPCFKCNGERHAKPACDTRWTGPERLSTCMSNRSRSSGSKI